MRGRLIAAILGCSLTIGLVLVGVTRADGAGYTPSCLEQQYALRSMGYVAVKVDGTCGAIEIKATRHLQKVSGLVADGILGPITWAAIATAPAVRVEAPAPQTPPTEPCAEAAWYAERAGLPDTVDVRYGTGGFDDHPIKGRDGYTNFGEQAIPPREAGCDNNAGNSCCGGWFGIHQGNITAPGYRAGFAACGINSRSDYQGPSAAQKTASACAAKVIYDWWVAHPGQPWPWRL